MGMRKTLMGVYWNIQTVIVPTLRYSQDLYENVLKTYVRPETNWLDIGCGHQILPEWRSEEEKRLVDNCKSIVGLDYDMDSLKHHKNLQLRVRGDINNLPFDDNSFDLITANMVIEHLEDPSKQFRDIHRVLSPGGYFIFHTPNALAYGIVLARIVPDILKKFIISILEGRKEKDVFRTYYRANSKKKIIQLATETEFTIGKIKMIVSTPMSAVIPPLVIFELILIRILMMNPFSALRSNIIGVLKK